MNRISSTYHENREERYKTCILDLLLYLPNEIIPIIVENNGKRSTFLEGYEHNGKSVEVIYTETNKYSFRNKGVNELLDIKEVIKQKEIKDEDMIIKVTGRYRILSSFFFDEVITLQNKYDAFVKFFGSCSLTYEKYDCLLGLYAMKVMYLNLLDPNYMNMNQSPEIIFAKYVRRSIYHYKEIEKLDLECIFSEDGRILIV